MGKIYIINALKIVKDALMGQHVINAKMVLKFHIIIIIMNVLKFLKIVIRKK